MEMSRRPVQFQIPLNGVSTTISAAPYSVAHPGLLRAPPLFPFFHPPMALPTSRELELETLLRQRDNQLAELSDEVTQLRQHLTSQTGPSTSDPITLPPALVSILLPQLHTSASASGATPGSNTVTAALTQRARLLQEENDELYDILNQGETGKLKEEVRGLRRIVERLEGALRESHQVISTLSTELDKSYENFTAAARPINAASSTKSFSQSPRTSYHTPHTNSTGNGVSGAKLPPTGPRAYKKPRLSESQMSPTLRTNPSLPSHKPHSQSHNSSRASDTREYTPRRMPEGRGKSNHVKMEVEEDQRARPPSPMQDRDRERERAPRERERERDGNRAPRRNGNFSGNTSRSGPGRRVEHVLASNDSFPGGDRTLAERMGL